MRDLLRAIADPHDPAKRLRACLTPFFALSLAELPAAARAGGADPRGRSPARLARGRGARQISPGLFGRILDDSGLARRELFAGDACAG